MVPNYVSLNFEGGQRLFSCSFKGGQDFFYSILRWDRKFFVNHLIGGRTFISEEKGVVRGGVVAPPAQPVAGRSEAGQD